MIWKRRGWTLISTLLAVPGLLICFAVAGLAQIVTTQVTDTIYRADGTLANGTVLVSWSAFTNAQGESVPAGSSSATITSGALSIALAPNAGATPMGTYYTAVYHLDDGTTSRDYWVVPASSTAVHLAAIRSSVLPTSVAMQTVSKAYVDTAIAAAVAGAPLDASNPYVLKAGDTMTGPLVLPGDPTTPLEATDKQYVDAAIAGLTGGLAQKVSTLPQATQVVAQPTGTDLEVNRLNGTGYASQYISGRGDNGIANATASTDCANGCEVNAEQSYASGEKYIPSNWNRQTHIEDDRKGQRREVFLDPESVLTPGIETGEVVDVTSTRSGATVHQATSTGDPGSFGLQIFHQALGGGNNHFPQYIGSGPPYFKSEYSGLAVYGTYNTQGQHVLAPLETHCYGVGDCLIGSQYIYSSGGMRDDADEGTHPMDLQIYEDTHVFTGTCASSCTTGSTSLTITATANPGTQGDGRFLIDTNPAKVIASGSLTGTGAAGPNASAAFSGTAFPVSTFFRIAQAIPSQANDVAPGTVTVALATTGLPTGFASNTAAAPAASGVACIADPASADNGVENFEMANYSTVDGTHLQFTLNKAHNALATVSIGGLCGYGLEQTVDTQNGIRQVFPVIGSYSATGLYYAGSATPIVGLTGNTSGFTNISLSIASIARSNNTVTITTAGNLPYDVNGLKLTIAGVADSGYNGTFTVSTTGPNTLTYAQSGANSTSSGGAISYLTGGYTLYPMAEVLSVMNAATKTVDGTMTLAPNTVAWAASDPVEQPHYYQQRIYPDVEFVGQTLPRPAMGQQGGIEYDGLNGPGLTGWMVRNATPASSYFGNGGTHTPPSVALGAYGVWKRTLDAQAGEQSVFSIHCNSHGCGKWDSGYNLFELDSNVGTDTIAYQPTTSALTMSLRGSGYSFTPQAFTANTINAVTLNATTINGSLSAASLSIFGASGSAHAQGAVPDPGATAGTTRYLREDGTWAVPAGSVSGSTVSATSGAALPAGAIADYNFLQGSGSTLTDATSNGNNATLGTGTAAPVWTATGLSFSGNETVSLPSALNAGQTFAMGFCATPVPFSASSVPQNVYPTLISSTMTGAQGLQILYGYSMGSSTSILAGTFAPTIVTRGGHTTQSQVTFAGCHVMVAALGTSGTTVDHIYLDGNEVDSYGLQGASAGAQTSGNLIVGVSSSSDWENGSGFSGTMHRLVVYPTQLSSAVVAQLSTQIAADMQSRGVALNPQKMPLGTPQLFAIGDSITYGAGASTPWENLLSLANQPAFNINNDGVGGISLRAISGSEANRVATRCISTSGPNLAIVFAGTNDFYYPTDTQSTFSALSSEVQTLKLAGCRVFVGTMLSRGGNGVANNGQSWDADKDAFDALVLSGAKTIGADGIIDFAANPLLGADGADANTTYFNTDNIHPTQTGQQLLANAANNALNYAFGYNELNPHVVTSLPYNMSAADGEVSLASLTSAGTLTLPDCTGQSGAVYRINNPQSTYAVTVRSLNSSQLISGFATVTVPANGTLVLRDVPNPKTVSGCHWE